MSCCANDSQCGGHTPRCDPATRSCAECLPENDNCPTGRLCIPNGSSWQCSSDCVSTQDCARLGAAFKCCSSRCTNTTTDILNCGACGVACATAAHATPVCATLFCDLGACDTGYGNCDRNPDNGCETATDTDARNCGACGARCDLPNATSTCTSGRCAVRTCVGNFLDCNATAADGCESTPASDPLNCGACGNVCPAPANGSPVCKQGQCGLGTCNAGFADCDGNAANGCETSLADDPKNCGSCGRSCTASHAVSTCKDRMCQISSCNVQYGDCNQLYGDGCEVDLSGDVGHCGMCGNACMMVNRGVAGCAGGVCGVAACNAGFGDCDKQPANGCETDLSSLANCGSCNAQCAAPPNATAACNAGVCGIGMCKAPFADCDRQGMNGCEVDTTTDASNCGGCGKVCLIPNARSACANANCALMSCNQGYENCDGQPANGCEVRTETDAKNCGQCGNACANAALCVAGKCQANSNCRGIKLAAPNSPDGMYTIDPDGAGPMTPFAVYCDMTTDGGGWTVVAYARDEVYMTPPPPIGNGAGKWADWIAHEWKSDHSYYLALARFDALTDGNTSVMQMSRNQIGQVLSQLKLNFFDYNAVTNKSSIGACVNLVGTPCGSAWSWSNFPPDFDGDGRNNICNSQFGNKIWNYHNFVSCASDSGLFRFDNTTTARPQLLGNYMNTAFENFIMVR